MPFAVLTACFLALFASKRGVFRLFLAIFLIGIIAYLFGPDNHDYFSTHGRYQAWEFFMGNWYKQSTMTNIFGTGTGTYFEISQRWQNMTGFNLAKIGNKMTGYYIFLHSDILQILFEQGIVGLTLITLLSIHCLRMAYKNKQIEYFAAFIAYIACCAGNYPIRLGVHGIIGVSIIWLCLYNGDAKIEVTENNSKRRNNNGKKRA